MKLISKEIQKPFQALSAYKKTELKSSSSIIKDKIKTLATKFKQIYFDDQSTQITEEV